MTEKTKGKTQTPQTQKPQPTPEVRGLTEADYQRWRHNPATKWFLQYLRDYRADLLQAANDQWLASNLELSTAEEMKGRINCLEELVTLPFSAIAQFYDDVVARAKSQEEEDAK